MLLSVTGDAFGHPPQYSPFRRTFLGNRFNRLKKSFLHEESQPKGRITASLGIVYLDGQSAEELILCTEKALASAILKGGDRVEIYSGEQDETAKVIP
jgi:GGDEF domain-containing protein